MKIIPVVAAMLMIFSSCTPADTTNADQAALSVKDGKNITETEVKNPMNETITPASAKFYDNVKRVGRTYIENDILWCALSGTGVTMNASGTELTVNIVGGKSAGLPDNKDNWARVAVLVDGVIAIDTQIDSAEKALTVPLAGADKTSVVKVVKLSESAESLFGISGITCDGSFSPAPDADFLIEYIGDSITCGYGIDDPVKEHHFSTSTENFLKTYAYKTAEALGVDYSAVCFSGHGIISGYTGNGIKQPAQIVPKLYSRIGSSADMIGSRFPAVISWDFAANKEPDLIVINLGTNDDSYCGDDPERQAEFTEKYTEFLTKVRERNPNSTILCTLGVLGDRLYPFVEKAAKDYTEQTGDSNIHCLRFDVQIPSDGYAADWHPSDASQTKMADRLTAWIRENMNI